MPPMRPLAIPVSPPPAEPLDSAVLKETRLYAHAFLATTEHLQIAGRSAQ